MSESREPLSDPLSRRERELLGALYRLGPAPARELQKQMRGAPAYSTVRTILSIMERKGHVRHHRIGAAHVYYPAIPLEEAQDRALADLVMTYFAGSVDAARRALSKRAAD